MRNPIVVLVVVALAAGGAGLASAAPSKAKRRVPAPTVPQATFSDAGEFSGRLDETIGLNGLSYRLSPDVVIYEIGRGLLPAGSRLMNRQVFLRGVERGGLRIVEQIMIRPEFPGSPAPITEHRNGTLPG